MGYYDDYLEHHGIKGQKWGVRRFEKEGGGLTPAGQARYNTVNGKYQKLKSAKAAKKSALAEYNKDFAKAYNAQTRLNITTKRKADRDAKINKAYESGKKADNAINDYKKAKVDYKFEKKIAKNEADAERMMGLRAKNRAKLEKEAEKVANNLLKSEIMKTKIKDFDEGSELVKAAYERYGKTLSEYRDVKIKSIGDKSYKKSEEYETASKAYKDQVKSDRAYGKDNTRFRYALEERLDRYKKKMTVPKDTKPQSESDVIKDLSKSASKRTDIDDEELELIRELERSNRK